jgi:tetratricopeptide (TPR) repeat protein
VFILRNVIHLALGGLILAGMAFSGCQRNNELETAAALEKAGQYDRAILLCQNYLKKYPASALTPHIYYLIAKDYGQGADYANAMLWYEKIIAQYPQTPEGLQALLDESALYKDKLKNTAKAYSYSEKAVGQYFANSQIKDDIQFLVEAQYQSATAFFAKKDFKSSNQVAASIFEAYPVLFVNPDSRARVEALVDRTRRALGLAQMDASEVSIRGEEPFNKSFEAEFDSNTLTAQNRVLSPLGDFVVSRKQVSKAFYLYLAKNDPKGEKFIFKIIPHTSGANLPTWSPDESSLVYLRSIGGGRRLERMDLKTGKSLTIFHSDDASLGLYPVYHPSGSKIAFVYDGNAWLVNSDGTDKTLLKTNEKLDYTAHLTWSGDGTMLRCQMEGKKQKAVDEVLTLDVGGTFNP